MNRHIAFFGILLLFSITQILKAQNVFKDKRDNKTYKTINIGKQIWMKENLNYETTNNSWGYDDNSANALLYGRLYTWEEANRICPDGWHLPSNVEWEELFIFLDDGAKRYDEKNFDVANKLKKEGSFYWYLPKKNIQNNPNVTNSSGFTALPGGLRDPHGKFYWLGGQAIFWSSSFTNIEHYYYLFWINKSFAEKNTAYAPDAYSVRCIKNPSILNEGLILNKLLKINSNTELIKYFGKENVKSITDSFTYWNDEQEKEIEVKTSKSILYANSTLEVIFQWKNDNFTVLEKISINNPNSSWRTLNGVKIGTSLKELEKVNQKPFLFYGFGLDGIQGGIIDDFQGGKLNANTISISFSYNENLLGIGYEGAISSDLEIARKNNLYVGEIILKAHNKGS